MKLLVDLFKQFSGAILPILTVFAPVLALFGGLVTVINELPNIHAALQSFNAYASSASWGGLYGKVNMVFPLGESNSIMAALAGYQLLALGIRLIKSLIPGEN